MIHPHDLRLGNYILPNKKSIPMYVSSLGEDWIDCNFEGNEADPWEVMPSDAVGIPLTIDILLHSGFEELHDQEDLLSRLAGHKRIFCKDGYMIVLWCGSFYSVETCEDDFYSDIRKSILYVHTLQNDFYNKVEEELKIKL